MKRRKKKFLRRFAGFFRRFNFANRRFVGKEMAVAVKQILVTFAKNLF